MPKKAVVLLSGGLDSATVLAIASSNLSLRTRSPLITASGTDGNWSRHPVSRKKPVSARHEVVPFDLRAFGGSALTGDIACPERVEMFGSRHSDHLRSCAEYDFPLLRARLCRRHSGVRDIFIGVNALDYSGYPDCRPEYIAAYERMANLATKAGVEGSQRLTIHTPLIHLTKAEIIRTGLCLGVDYSLTSSCYDPSPLASMRKVRFVPVALEGICGSRRARSAAVLSCRTFAGRSTKQNNSFAKPRKN